MRTLYKRTLLIITILLITTGVSGCMIMNQIDSMTKKATLKDRMMEYINERYDDTFTYLEDLFSYGRTERSIAVTCERYPDEYVTVTCFSGSGREIFNDNYLYFKYREQTIEAIQEALEKAFNYDFKLYYDYTRGMDVRIIPADASFNEYVGCAAARLGFTAVLAPGFDIDDRNKMEDKLRDTFVSRGIVVNNADIRFCNDVVVYENLDKATFSSFTFADTGPVLRLSRIGQEDGEFWWR